MYYIHIKEYYTVIKINAFKTICKKLDESHQYSVE